MQLVAGRAEHGFGLAACGGFVFGDDDGGVVQEPVEHAHGGGASGRPTPLFERPLRGDRE